MKLATRKVTEARLRNDGYYVLRVDRPDGTPYYAAHRDLGPLPEGSTDSYAVAFEHVDEDGEGFKWLRAAYEKGYPVYLEEQLNVWGRDGYLADLDTVAERRISLTKCPSVTRGLIPLIHVRFTIAN